MRRTIKLLVLISSIALVTFGIVRAIEIDSATASGKISVIENSVTNNILLSLDGQLFDKQINLPAFLITQEQPIVVKSQLTLGTESEKTESEKNLPESTESEMTESNRIFLGNEEPDSEKLGVLSETSQEYEKSAIRPIRDTIEVFVKNDVKPVRNQIHLDYPYLAYGIEVSDISDTTVAQKVNILVQQKCNIRSADCASGQSMFTVYDGPISSLNLEDNPVGVVVPKNNASLGSFFLKVYVPEGVVVEGSFTYSISLSDLSILSSATE